MKTYDKITYVNDSAPYLNAENLNHAEDGIEAVTEAVSVLERDIAQKADNTALQTVSEALNGKADEQAVNDALALKADKNAIPDVSGFATSQQIEKAKEELQANIDTKASLAYVNTELGKKANTDQIPTTLPTTHALKLVIDGAATTFDGSAEVTVSFENANGKTF